MVGWMAATNLDVTWDCFPTGHGKGPWDSEGYQLKRYAFDVARSAQRYKLKGEISDARSLFEVASQKMKVADPSNSISQRVFNFLPDITDNSPSYGEKPIHGIRNNFFSFRSLVKGYQNIVQEYTMGYRAIHVSAPSASKVTMKPVKLQDLEYNIVEMPVRFSRPLKQDCYKASFKILKQDCDKASFETLEKNCYKTSFETLRQNCYKTPTRLAKLLKLFTFCIQ
eukprot:TRINITY_DN574_c0_g1_i9.p1 TRINITY_DN574_c0_g1~~TRINITY_DN574_c0_g1_i9.p1  ORF type:complete len:225 (-),score=26.11 TRINITY_DN574_c0_g1_i9:482-1156(-)